jgi:hypothetical protein
MASPEIERSLTSLAETPEAVAVLARDLDDAPLRQQAPGDFFSFVETACHLRDLEREGYGVRIERILGEDRPWLEDFDGTKVAEERAYREDDFHAALRDFADARSRSLVILRGLEPEHFDRGAELDGTGPVTLAGLLGMMVEHDAIHMRELTELRARLTGQANAAG